MFNLIIKSFWLFLPAGVANMSPVLFKWLPIANIPIDFGKTLGGKPIIGPHKTYRGLFVGIFFSIATVYLQKIMYPTMATYSIVDYSEINIWLLGFLLGIGALGGDLIKSLIKRRLNIEQGKVWAPFDQIDWILGAIIAASLMVRLDTKIILASIILFGILHPIINLLGFFLKIKKNKF